MKIVTQNGTALAHVFRYSKGKDFPKKANAHLMAAAPEMLEALRAVVRAYRNADVVPTALAEAEAAIAKATGGGQ